MQDSWCLYEAPNPRKRIFRPKKRALFAPMLSIAAAMLVLFEVASRF